MAFSRKAQLVRALKIMKRRNELFKKRGEINTSIAVELRMRIERLKKKLEKNG